MPRDVPNYPVQDYPFPSIIVDTMLRERTSSFSGTWTPVEPGTPFITDGHSADQLTNYGDTIFLGQKAGKDNEFQERVWAIPPSTQDLYNYDQSFSDGNTDYPIFKRRYLELRDQYPFLIRSPNSGFTGVYAVGVTSGGTGYPNGGAVTFTGGGGSGASAIAITNPTTGSVVKITLKSEGSGYTSAPTPIFPAGGTGGTATAIVQPPTCQLISESVVPASGEWTSLYFMVERVYETLDGPIRQNWTQDPATQLSISTSKQRIVTSEVEDPTPTQYQNISIDHINTAVSEITIEEVDTTIDTFFLTFPGNENIRFPKVLTEIDATWDTATGAGSYSETATPIAFAVPCTINLNAEGTGQGSASVLGGLNPIFAPDASDNLPIIDYYFFLKNPVSRSAILTRCAAIATILAGTATDVSDWPVFAEDIPVFTMVGEKASVSQRAVARSLTSLSGSSGSAVTSVGAGGSTDMGSNVKEYTFPSCIHGAFTITGSTTVTGTDTATASAVVNGEGVFPPASSTPSPITGAASGFIFPTGVDATPIASIPSTGLALLRPDVSPYRFGYSVVRARIFDFSVLPS